MEIDCDSIVERYLLIRNPLYTFSFPISILIAIIIYGIMKAYDYSENSYINQILIPLTALLVSLVLIDMLCRALINKDEKERIKKLCLSYMNDPNKFQKILREKALNIKDVESYNGNIDGFDNNDNEQELKEEDEIDILEDRTDLKDKHIFDNVLTKFIYNPNLMESNKELVGEFPKDKIRCVGDTRSYKGNLCSGAGDKPSELVAAIPGPQWLSQDAETVQRRLKTKNYTKSRCMGSPENYSN